MVQSASAVIAEDEPILAAELARLLGEVWPELAIAGVAEDGLQALQMLDRHAPGVLFLDIQMPGLTGLEVARQASGRSHVVFVTAYDEYAVAAFEQGAVDYVMKPLSAARIATTAARLKAKLATEPPANLDGLLRALAARSAQRPYLRWITATQGNDLRLITVDEIVYVRADNKYTLVVTRERESLIRRTVRELAEELDPQQFWQIHRGTLVNIGAVAGITREGSGRMRVRFKDRPELLPVSEPYMHQFRSM